MIDRTGVTTAPTAGNAVARLLRRFLPDPTEDESVAEETIELQINGQRQSADTDPDRPLLDVLREDFHLTGTKFGCGEGECGACTVLVDGVPTRSCITSVGEVGGTEVQTIEGLAQAGQLHGVQQAFLDHQAMQCGYCVPGHIMTAVALAKERPNASRDEIVAEMSQHICRCCNYENILAAVQQAVQQS
ncbi:(2Fe-2S)-binding protein [Roseiconus nitratireducens]|uniref:(2Fe-2S)-binding protein n=1 Tax=Roseiconus nitratireducens TaxID=2605748 RepID=A0A5M6DKU6_9BACT|nr:(2Fe-2S)-binding protein [Roseiconus nitratireducens]KAA5546859.1 (2Fe-2S)-binding protein [Roseiconus nitratireducens]